MANAEVTFNPEEIWTTKYSRHFTGDGIKRFKMTDIANIIKEGKRITIYLHSGSGSGSAQIHGVLRETESEDGKPGFEVSFGKIWKNQNAASITFTYDDISHIGYYRGKATHISLRTRL